MWCLLFPNSSGWLISSALPGPPTVKQLMQMVTVVPGQGGQFQCASPNSTTMKTGIQSPFNLITVIFVYSKEFK